MKQVVYHIQFPIIKIPNKPQIPSSFAKILVPHFFYCRIPMSGQSEEMRESLGQHCTPTPKISPEPDFSVFSHFKSQFFPTPSGFLQNLLPNPHSKLTKSLFCPPTEILLPILCHEHLFPKILLSTSKSPNPFAKQGFVQEG